jgi:hypothetical protein
MGRVDALVVLLVLAAVAPVTVAAQGTTPAAGTDATEVVACTVEPRPVDEIVAFWFDPAGTPLAEPRPSSPVIAEAELPGGEPVNQDTVAAITATLGAWVACLQESQYARAFALMTDDLVRRSGPNFGDPVEDTAANVRARLQAQLVGTPGPLPRELRRPAPPLRDARLLPDDRVGAVWETGGDVIFVVFVRQDGGWLIADMVDVMATAGTPIAAPPA